MHFYFRKKVISFPNKSSMIQRQNGSGRRILTFPAVHPCESIALTTLLSSLIDLAQSICSFKNRFFSSNARNARETIRQISNLHVFLLEAQASGLGFPDSVVLSFSELHLALQKVHYLLEDCTREGSCLWMLMKSDRLAGLFRVMSRAIATGLDVLPIETVDVSGEVKELVELIMKQARKGRFNVDSEDKIVSKKVLTILKDFENGVVPGKAELKEVLDYVGIKKWSDCSKEVKFLEGEIEFQYSNGDKRREIDLLSGLMGLMCYSRCVLFDSVDTNFIYQQHDKSCSNEGVVGCLNSDDFRCPISLEVMEDPVTIETGHTYDRSSIQRWFRAGNPTCPKTGYKLKSLEFVPNLSLKQLIQQYCDENGVVLPVPRRKNRDITNTVFAGSLAAAGAMKMVAGFLSNKLEMDCVEERNKAAYEIRLLSKASIFNRSCLVEAGVIVHLLGLLRNPLTQENAIGGLLNLSKHSKSKAVIMENGGLELIVEVLKKGVKVEAMQHAAATLFYLASIEECRKLIGEATDAIPVLVDMIMKGSDRGKKNALVAIYGLLKYSGNHRRVLEAGAVPLLVNILSSSETEDLVTDSSAVLATLAGRPDGAKATLHWGALPQILGVLESSNSRTTREHCVALLLALCINGGADVIGLLVKSPSLMGSLYSLLTEGTSRASKKASAVIRILHEFYERRSSGSKSPVLPREQFVHVW